MTNGNDNIIPIGITPKSNSGKIVPDIIDATIQWHKGPALGGGGTAGKDEDTEAPLFYNGDRLILIIETTEGREIAVVDISCDEDHFSVTDASSGDGFDAWGPESWSWWAVLNHKNMPELEEAK